MGRLGHYEVLNVVGRGGMGVVLKALDTSLRRIVAIKVLARQFADNAVSRRRFIREAQAAAAVCHDNVVTIHAVEANAHPPHIVMQFIDGKSLQQRLEQSGPLELKEILRIGMQTAAGLAAAHAQGLVHRDIKPANILLENGVERVKITDFGLARAVDDATVSQPNVVAGTPQYMAPEQASGQLVDHRADLFSLGGVLYALCTGRPPFRAANTLAVLKAVCDKTPRAIREMNPDVPDDLVAVVNQLLAKNAADRFQSAAEVARVLEDQLAGVQYPKSTSQVAVLESTRPRAEPKMHDAANHRAKHRLVIAAIVLLALVGIGFCEAAGITQLVPTVIRVVRGDGTLVVEVEDPTIKVNVDGEAIVITDAGTGEIRVRPGQHHVQASKGDRPMQSELVTVHRGGKQLVRIRVERDTPTDKNRAAPSPGIADATPNVRRFTGHSGTVRGLAFMPGGRRFLSASYDSTVRLWDLFSEKEISRFNSDQGWIYGLAVSMDGRLAISTGQNSTAILWDVAEGKRLYTINGREGVKSPSFSPDGKFFVFGNGDGTISAWSVRSPHELHSFKAHSNVVQSVALLPDGRRILSGGWDASLCIWDLEFGKDGQEVRRIVHGHTEGINAVAVLPDGRSALSVSRDTTVRLWDLETGRQIRRFVGHSGAVLSVAASPDGKQALTGGMDGTMCYWDVASGRQIARYEADPGGVFAIAFCPDGKSALSGGEDGVIRHWQLSESLATAAAPPATVAAPTRKPGLTLMGDFGKSVVWITTTKKSKDGRDLASATTGIVIALPKSGRKVVITSAAVFPDSQTSPGPVAVLVGGRQVQCPTWAHNETSDIGVLVLDDDYVAPVALADGRETKAGETVIAIGFDGNGGFGMSSGFVKSVHQGPLSRTEFRTDLELDSCYAGGPLVSSQGQLVGMHLGAVPSDKKETQGKNGWRHRAIHSIVAEVERLVEATAR